ADQRGQDQSESRASSRTRDPYFRVYRTRGRPAIGCDGERAPAGLHLVAKRHREELEDPAGQAPPTPVPVGHGTRVSEILLEHLLEPLGDVAVVYDDVQLLVEA